MIDLYELKEHLHYNPDTGVWVWVVRPARNVFPGVEAGCVGTTGHRHINVKKCHYLAHVLAWFYMTGEWPPEGMEVEHRDRNPRNNRWENLRLASRAENNRNVARRTDNTSGVKGVKRRGNKWEAAIRDGVKQRYLGRFDTAEQAHRAYCAAAVQLHGEFACFG